MPDSSECTRLTEGLLTRVLKALISAMSGLASALLFFVSSVLFLAGTVHTIRTLIVENPFGGETSEGFLQVGIGLLTLLVGYGLAEVAVRLLPTPERTTAKWLVRAVFGWVLSVIASAGITALSIVA